MKTAKISKQTFQANTSLYSSDIRYKQMLRKGLKDKFNISCELKHLSSIVGPEELKRILKQFSAKNYSVGDDYRVNLHIHTVCSDGTFTVNDFLEQSVDYANYVARKLKGESHIPPFTAAITDHDKIGGTQKAIAEISKNPEQFKNFKFVPGCEFMFHGASAEQSFEAVGLSFNPFDTNLTKLMRGFSSVNCIEDIKDVKKAGGILSRAHPLVDFKNVTIEHFLYLKKLGINAIEGHYQYNPAWWENIGDSIEIIHKLAKKFNMLETGGHDNHETTIFADWG